MAYSNSWDETDPDGAVVSSSQIDEEINQVKTDVRERIEQVIPGWADDTVDPKVLGEGEGRILVDTEGNLPGSPDFEGQVFYATDTDNLYVATDASTWTQFTPSGTGGGSKGSGYSLLTFLNWSQVGNSSGSLRTLYTGVARTDASEVDVLVQMPFQCEVFHFEVYWPNTPGTGNSVTYVVRKNQADTALSAQITDSGTRTLEASTSVQFAKDDDFSVAVELTDGITADNPAWKLRVQDLS